MIVEEGDGVGGAWHWNRYPGIQVDIPSFSYQFSFRQRPDWSRVYAPGDELKAYAEDCVDHYGLRPQHPAEHARHRRRLGRRRPRLAARRRPAASTITARHVDRRHRRAHEAQAAGHPGRRRLRRHDDAHRPLGRRRRPARQARRADRHGRLGGAGHPVDRARSSSELTVFQRTPIWCLPKLDGPMPGALRGGAAAGARACSRRRRLASQAYVELTFPLAAHYADDRSPWRSASEGLALRLLREQVRDPEVRDKLTPRYGLGCKRPGFSNDYLRDVQPPERAPRDGADHRGRRRRRSAPPTATAGPFDVLILATGFKVFEPGNMPPFPVRGAGGADLETFWTENRFQAYQGVSVPRLPEPVLDPRALRLQRRVVLHADREPVAPHRALPRARARSVGATRVEVTPRGQRPLLRRDARPPRPADLLPGRAARRRTRTTSTSTATSRSAPRRRSR